MGQRRDASDRVRLVDVAAHAGVSMKTVSNVVHRYPHVRPELRARVQAAIDELGYRPNLTARRLVTGRTGMLALALPGIDHPYFSELAGRVAEVAPELGYRVLIEQTLGEVDAERAVIADRENGLVDGVVFNPIWMSSEEIAGLRRDVPLVLIGEAARPPSADHVMIDNVAAGREATLHLLSSGRRRIAFLGIVPGDPTDASRLRLQGYQEAHREAGVHADPGLVVACTEYSDGAAAAALASLLEYEQIDAVVCREDRFAIAALRVLAAVGQSVPGDVAVLGWDDTSVARWSTPAITSVAPDKRALARVALELVHDRITGYQGEGRHVIVPHTLAIRDSG